jgi:heptosyltransferase-1
MRILLVKTSSLGDVIHNLPVVSDLKRAHPDATIDWCVEEGFVDIPRLHPGVAGVIPVAVRRWRKSLCARATWREIGEFRRRIAATPYDAILDTQGLVKSALIARQARGVRLGYAAEVAREPLAARFYDRTFVIAPNAHAVERNRWLAAAAFDLPAATLGDPPDYGIVAPASDAPWLPPNYAVLFTATSRDDKLWAEESWVQLALTLAARGVNAVLPAGSAVERARAERIAASVAGALVAPPLRLRELAGVVGGARLAIGVDTGLAHLATALGVPTIALFMASDPTLTGVLGRGYCRNLGARGRAPTVAEVLAAAQPELR